jgi:hypothetical protein
MRLLRKRAPNLGAKRIVGSSSAAAAHEQDERDDPKP